ncbi:MAG: hypothetical protein LKG42_08785 [Eubacterium sp.]|jgi:hypothetical protein|nr:hypothetical protein [Eubacterium sp.]MCH4110474.1 hypothetical protein [Eubacterium sp.]MCI1308098.1 hypothetical protein [Eubacterium sp.]MCI1406567.1 hypothetical protein [Eubacterium sp.]MCI1429035.1 hypothetical protein [Eubacterium sp.]
MRKYRKKIVEEIYRWGIFRKLKERKGGYIAEAAIIVPVFILAVIALIGIIPVISMAENLVFASSDELRREMVLCGLHPSASRMPVLLEVRARRENRELQHLYITGYQYRFSHGTIDDLIEVRMLAKGGVHDPLGKFDDIRFPALVTGRAFTGRLRSGSARGSFMDDERLVWIFPEDGIRYHEENCQHVRACCKMQPLSDAIKKHYHPCPNCRASSASLGSPVYVFERAGDAYHYGSCRSVTRWCSQVSLKEARELGYTACRTCGG